MTDAPRPTCTGQLSGGPLTCTQDTGHDYGCTFTASGAPDGHTTTEDDAERNRG